MKVGHTVAASLMLIVGTLANAGVATARTTTTTTGQSKDAVCARAEAQLPKLQGRIAHLNLRRGTLQTLLADTESNNQIDLAQSIQVRIDTIDKVHDHLMKVVSDINTRCPT